MKPFRALQRLYVSLTDSLTGKITLAIFVTSFAVILLLGTLFVRMSTRSVLKTRFLLMESSLETTAKALDDVFKLPDSIAFQMLADPSVLEALSQPDYDYNAGMELYNRATQGIRNASKLYTAVSKVALYAKNGYQEQVMMFSTRGVRFADYGEAMEYYGSAGVPPEESLSYPVWAVTGNGEDSGKREFINLRILRHPRSNQPLSLLEVEISDTYIQGICGALEGDSVLLRPDGSVISGGLAGDGGGALRLTLLDSAVTSGQRQGGFLHGSGADRLLVSYIRLPAINGYLILAESYSLFLSEQGTMRGSILLLALACLLISVFSARMISRRLTRSLLGLQQTMEQVRGDRLEVRYAGAKERETRSLGELFNAMLDRIGDNIREIRQKEEQNRQNEIRLLQSQINPHLLYNTLDSAIWRLENRDTDAAVGLLTAMSDFFKISLSKGAETVTIGRELEHIRRYLELHSLSGGRRYTLACPEGPLLDCPIVKTTLQPIVENSVLHGFEGYDGGDVTVTLEREGEHGLLLSVLDNGMGMEEETLRSLRERLADPEPPEGAGGFGLWNVQQRIKKHFGEPWGLSVDSGWGEYTRVDVRLPCRSGRMKGEKPC